MHGSLSLTTVQNTVSKRKRKEWGESFSFNQFFWIKLTFYRKNKIQLSWFNIENSQKRILKLLSRYYLLKNLNDLKMEMTTCKIYDV